MRLEKLPDRDPIARKPIGLHQSVWDRIEQYQKLYKRDYGKEIKQSELLEQIVDSFMSSDKDFQKYLKDSTAPAA